MTDRNSDIDELLTEYFSVEQSNPAPHYASRLWREIQTTAAGSPALDRDVEEITVESIEVDYLPVPAKRNRPRFVLAAAVVLVVALGLGAAGFFNRDNASIEAGERSNQGDVTSFDAVCEDMRRSVVASGLPTSETLERMSESQTDWTEQESQSISNLASALIQLELEIESGTDPQQSERTRQLGLASFERLASTSPRLASCLSGD